MKNRYKVCSYSYTSGSLFGAVNAGDTARVDVVDTHSHDQVVASFPVKTPVLRGKSCDMYGVYINDARLARKMAKLVCEQLNRESGY